LDYNWFEKNFYSYKNIMPENEQNLGGTVGTVDLSAVSLQNESTDTVVTDNALSSVNSSSTLE
jgi:hypothetical protein